MYKLIENMNDYDLKKIWDHLKDYNPKEFYNKDIPMDDYAYAIYSQISKREAECKEYWSFIPQLLVIRIYGQSHIEKNKPDWFFYHFEFKIGSKYVYVCGGYWELYQPIILFVS